MPVNSSRRLLALAATALALFLCSANLRAGVEMDFFNGLVDRGYHDLALDQLDRMETATDLPKPDRGLLPLLRGQVYLAMARASADPAQRAQLMIKASESYKKFEAANPSHPRLVEVSLDQAWMMLERASAAAEACRLEKDAAKKAKLLPDAEALYKQGIDETAKVSAALEEKQTAILKKRPVAKDDLLEVVMMRVKALMQIADTEYLCASIFDANSPKRAEHLEAALKAYDVVGSERPNTNFTYLALVREGTCLVDLANIEKDARKRQARITSAKESFDAALKCKREDSTARIRLQALHQKAALCYQLQDYEAAADTTDAYLREAGALIADRDGQEVILLRAQAQAQHAFDLKNRIDPSWRASFDEAVKSLQTVGPQFPSLRTQANSLMQTWLTKAGIDPFADSGDNIFVLVSVARKLLDAGSLDDALDAFQKVAARAEAPDDRRYAADSWLNIGAIYYKKKGYYEAAITWDRLLTDYSDVCDRTPDVAWFQVQVFAALSTQSQDPFDLDKYIQSLDAFLAGFPKDPRRPDALTRATKTLDALAKTSPDYQRPHQLILRVRTLCALNQPDAAEPFAAELAAKFPTSPEYAAACLELAGAFKSAGNADKSAQWQKSADNLKKAGG